VRALFGNTGIVGRTPVFQSLALWAPAWPVRRFDLWWLSGTFEPQTVQYKYLPGSLWYIVLLRCRSG
jgi:hypothetical protein